MDNVIRAAAYVLGDDIDTDQIIPARHLVIPLGDPKQRKRYGGFALSGVPSQGAGLPNGGISFSDPTTNRSKYAIVIAGRNFGCGSSREHAPVALYEAGVQAVVARSFARIFFRNAIDGGYFPPIECESDLNASIQTGDEVILDTARASLKHFSSGRVYMLEDLGAAWEIISNGGLFAYARRRGLI